MFLIGFTPEQSINCDPPQTTNRLKGTKEQYPEVFKCFHQTPCREKGLNVKYKEKEKIKLYLLIYKKS